MDQDPFHGLGKVLLAAAAVLAIAALFLMWMPRLPLIGRLPGDFVIRKKNFTFYFPIATSILLSLILSLILWLLRR